MCQERDLGTLRAQFRDIYLSKVDADRVAASRQLGPALDSTVALAAPEDVDKLVAGLASQLRLKP